MTVEERAKNILLDLKTMDLDDSAKLSLFEMELGAAQREAVEKALAVLVSILQEWLEVERCCGSINLSGLCNEIEHKLTPEKVLGE